MSSKFAGFVFDFETLKTQEPNEVVCVLRDHWGRALCKPTICTTPSLGPADRDAPECKGDVYHITIRGGLRREDTI